MTRRPRLTQIRGRMSLSGPIYFFQLRDGYAYGWCELEGKVLSIFPHLMSGRKTRQFNHPTNRCCGPGSCRGDDAPEETGRSSLSAPDTKRIQ